MIKFACVGLVTLFATTPAIADALPARKGGLWELKTAMDEGTGPREQTFKMCISDEMEANTVKASMEEHRKNCETYEIKSQGAAVVVNAKCLFNGRHVDSVTTMSGDFKTAFEVKIDSTTADQRESTAQTITVKRTIIQNGAYLGQQCGELQPGEAATADGAKVTVQ